MGKALPINWMAFKIPSPTQRGSQPGLRDQTKGDDHKNWTDQPIISWKIKVQGRWEVMGKVATKDVMDS
jgi:hypothetical protein